MDSGIRFLKSLVIILNVIYKRLRECAASLSALQSLPPSVGAVQGERGESPVRHHFEDDVLRQWVLLLWSVDSIHLQFDALARNEDFYSINIRR